MILRASMTCQSGEVSCFVGLCGVEAGCGGVGERRESPNLGFRGVTASYPVPLSGGKLPCEDGVPSPALSSLTE